MAELQAASPRARLSDYGITVGDYPRGILNAITDIAGVCLVTDTNPGDISDGIQDPAGIIANCDAVVA